FRDPTRASWRCARCSNRISRRARLPPSRLPIRSCLEARSAGGCPPRPRETPRWSCSTHEDGACSGDRWRDPGKRARSGGTAAWKTAASPRRASTSCVWGAPLPLALPCSGNAARPAKTLLKRNVVRRTRMSRAPQTKAPRREMLLLPNRALRRGPRSGMLRGPRTPMIGERVCVEALSVAVRGTVLTRLVQRTRLMDRPRLHPSRHHLRRREVGKRLLELRIRLDQDVVALVLSPQVARHFRLDRALHDVGVDREGIGVVSDRARVQEPPELGHPRIVDVEVAQEVGE